MNFALVAQARSIKVVMANSDLIEVAVGIIFNAQEEVLITKRSKTSSCPSLWEFPGGKLEKAETSEQALVRELQEEVNITCKNINFWLTHVGHFVKLHVFFVHEFSGVVKCLESQQGFKWVAIDELDNFTFPKTNNFLISSLKSHLNFVH